MTFRPICAAIALAFAFGCGSRPGATFELDPSPTVAADELSRASGSVTLAPDGNGGHFLAVGTGYSLAELLGGRPAVDTRQLLLRVDKDRKISDVGQDLGFAPSGGMVAPLFADLDGDGDEDLIATMIDAKDQKTDVPSPDHVYENVGGSFVDRGTLGIPVPGTTYAVCPGDYDGDGDLDLFLANHSDVDSFQHDSNGYVIGEEDRLYRNDGNFQFVDVTDASGLGDVKAWNNACLAQDVDGDGKLDLWMAYEQHPKGVTLYRNDGNLHFTDISETALGNAVHRDGNWMGFASGDYDGDGDTDVFVTNMGISAYLIGGTSVTVAPDGYSFHMLLRNDGQGHFEDVGPDVKVQREQDLPKIDAKLPDAARGVAALEFGWTAYFVDYDNDGDLDLYWAGNWGFSATAQIIGTREKGANPGILLENDGKGSFREISQAANVQTKESSGFLPNVWGSAFADLDGDGNLELLTATQNFDDPAHPGGIHVFHNKGSGNKALEVELHGHASGPYGFGAKVELTVEGLPLQTRERTSASAISGPDILPLHFGLGGGKPKKLVVRWPKGGVSELDNLPASGRVTVEEP